MSVLLDIVRVVAVLAAAGLLGNWFLSEVKKAKATGMPWYDPYLSPPGIIIACVIILFPILLWLMQKG